MEKMELSEDKMIDAKTVKRKDIRLKIAEPLNSATIVVRLGILAKNAQHPKRKECLSAIKIKKKTKKKTNHKIRLRVNKKTPKTIILF